MPEWPNKIKAVIFGFRPNGTGLGKPGVMSNYAMTLGHLLA